MKSSVFYFASAATLVAGVAAASPISDADPRKLVDAAINCTGVADSAPRLQCYDETVGALKAAREQNSKIFEQPAPAPAREEFKEVNSTALSVAELEPGYWLLVLADHSVWRTGEALIFEPKAGDTVHIAKGGFGGFVANINGQRAVHVRRMR